MLLKDYTVYIVALGWMVTSCILYSLRTSKIIISLFLGVNVNDRWREMLQLWDDTHADDHILVRPDTIWSYANYGGLAQSQHSSNTIPGASFILRSFSDHVVHYGVATSIRRSAIDVMHIECLSLKCCSTVGV